MQALALEPAPYKITTETSIEDLVGSIKTIGLLQPIIVARQEQGYVVLAGHRRAAAYLALGYGSITARILPQEASGIEKAIVAVSDNSFQRQLNLVEQARAVRILEKAGRRANNLEKLAAGSGLSVNGEMIDKLRRVADMPRVLQEALVSGDLSLPVALRLGESDRITAELLTNLFAKMGIGLNRQRQILTWLQEISLRDDVSIPQILQQLVPDWKADHKRVKDKGAWSKAVFGAIRSRRYPALAAAEKSFRENLKKMKLPPGMRIDPPPYFEGKNYKISLTINKTEDLERLGSHLRELAGMDETRRIFK